MTCAKHFPGHGDTSTDSHTGFPLVDKSMEELDELEFVPFLKNAENLDFIMTAHIQYPQLAAETYTSLTGDEVYLPATLSKEIITDVLRERLGMKGIVITDSMKMSAISDNFSQLDAAKLAINAGVDILLMPVDVHSNEGAAELEAFIDSIVQMVKNGEIEEGRIDDAVTRILTKKAEYGLLAPVKINVDEKLKSALSTVGSQEHREREWQMALEAITLAAGDGDFKVPEEGDTVLYFCQKNYALSSGEYGMAQLVKAGVISDRVDIHSIVFDDKALDDYKELIKSENVKVIILDRQTYNISDLDTGKPENTNAIFCHDLIEYAHENGKKVFVISALLPYDAPYFTDADAVLLAYNPMGVSAMPEAFDGETPAFGVNVSAAVYIALGGKNAEGKCPVQIPEP